MTNKKQLFKMARSFLAVAMIGLPFNSKAAKSADAAPEGKPERPIVEKIREAERVVLLVVNGHEITAKDYAVTMQKNVNMNKVVGNSPEARIAIIRQMVASQLIMEELKRQGIVNDKQSQEEKSAALMKFADANFPLPKTIDETTAYQFYQQHLEEFGIPEMVRVGQIQFVVPEDSADNMKSEARAKAEAALKRLEAGESFQKLAAELTENPLGKLPQGDLGYVAINSNPWLKKNLENVPKGGHTGVVESPAGFEILMKTDVRTALTTPYPNAREKVIQRAKVAGQQRLRDEYVARLAEKAKIDIKDAETAKLFPNGIFVKPSP